MNLIDGSIIRHNIVKILSWWRFKDSSMTLCMFFPGLMADLIRRAISVPQRSLLCLLAQETALDTTANLLEASRGELLPLLALSESCGCGLAILV